MDKKLPKEVYTENNGKVVDIAFSMRRNSRQPLDESSLTYSYEALEKEMTNEHSSLYKGQIVVTQAKDTTDEKNYVPWLIKNNSLDPTKYYAERIITYAYLNDSLHDKYVRKEQLGTSLTGVGTWADTNSEEEPTKSYTEIFNDYHNNNISVSASEENRYPIYSHLEGSQNIIIGNSDNSHVEGNQNTINDNSSYSHVEGQYNKLKGNSSHVEGSSNTVFGSNSHVEGFSNIASGDNTHVGGINSQALGFGAFAHGDNAKAGTYSVAIGTYVNAMPTDVDRTEANRTAFGTYNTSVSEGSFVEGSYNWAEGNSSHVEGKSNSSYGQSSHVEGINSVVYGYASHAEGSSNVGSKNNTADWSHAENASKNFGSYSHSEGSSIINAGSTYSHAEGKGTTIGGGVGTHVEGIYSFSSGNGTHAEGYASHAEGEGTHAEGTYTVAFNGSHAEGSYTYVEGKYSHVEGANTIAYGSWSHAEGSNTIVSADYSHAEGLNTYVKENGTGSHVEGNNVYSYANYSHVEGYANNSWGESSHVEGKLTYTYGTAKYSHAEGYKNKTIGESSHVEGYNNIAEGSYSHAEGYANTSHGESSHAEGNSNVSGGKYSHAEGFNTQSIGESSHAEGYNTQSSGDYSHAQGNNTIALGTYSSAEGYNTRAEGQASHAGSCSSIASGDFSFSNGFTTITPNMYEVGLGQFNRAYTTGVKSGVEDITKVPNEFARLGGKYIEGRIPEGTADKNGVYYYDSSYESIFTIGNGSTELYPTGPNPLEEKNGMNAGQYVKTNARHNVMDIRKNGQMYYDGGMIVGGEIVAPMSYSYVASLGPTAYFTTIMSALLNQPEYYRPTMTVSYTGSFNGNANFNEGNNYGKDKAGNNKYPFDVEIGTRVQYNIKFTAIRAAYDCQEHKDPIYGTTLGNMLGYTKGIKEIIYKVCPNSYLGSTTQNANLVTNTITIDKIDNDKYLGYFGAKLNLGKSLDGGKKDMFAYDKNGASITTPTYSNVIPGYPIGTTNGLVVGTEDTYTLFNTISYTWAEASQMYFQQLAEKGTYIGAAGTKPTEKWDKDEKYTCNALTLVRGRYKIYWGTTQKTSKELQAAQDKGDYNNGWDGLVKGNNRNQYWSTFGNYQAGNNSINNINDQTLNTTVNTIWVAFPAALYGCCKSSGKSSNYIYYTNKLGTVGLDTGITDYADLMSGPKKGGAVPLYTYLTHGPIGNCGMIYRVIAFTNKNRTSGDNSSTKYGLSVIKKIPYAVDHDFTKDVSLSQYLYDRNGNKQTQVAG